MPHTINSKWQNIILDYPNLQSILDTISQQESQNLLPTAENIFKCFDYFSPEETKVVILGQDPYHTPNVATGLSFAIQPTYSKIPPSLRNITLELKNDLNITLSDYTLENWAKQGVLMLNSSLTVTKGQPNSHSKIWKGFAQYIIDYLNTNYRDIIFVAWGAFAHKNLININTDKHHLLVSSHPSPFSALKPYKVFPPFIGSKPFSRINELLINENKINW